jgi:hypothetical protein
MPRFAVVILRLRGAFEASDVALFLPFRCNKERQPPARGLENRLIEESGLCGRAGRIRRRPRLGGLLNYYERAA